MSDQKVVPSGLDEEAGPLGNTCAEEHEERVNEEHEVVTGEEVDVEVQPDGIISSALPALLEPQSALVVAGDDADKSKMKRHSTLRSEKDVVYPLSMPLQDAIASLEFDKNVLQVALVRFLSTCVTCYCVSTLLNSGTPTNQIYTQVSALTNVLAPTSDGISKLDSTVQFRDIDSVDDIYKWLTDTFIPSVFVSTDHNGNPLPEDQRGRVALTNKVLGGVILEMIPFELRACDSYTVLTELYPNCTYTNEAAKIVSFLDIDMDAEDAKTAITALKANGSWVNYRTKQLITTLASYNGIGGTITVSRLTINFRGTGFIEMSASIKPIPDTRGSDFVFEIVFLGLNYVYLQLALWLDHSSIYGRRGRNPKGVVEFTKRVCGILWVFVLKYAAVIVFIGFYVKFMTFNIQDELIALADNDAKTLQETYRDAVAAIDALYTAAFWNNLVSIVGAVAVVQQGLSIIHQLRFHPQMNLFALTGFRALKQFRAFVVIFAIVFLTYAFAGCILFGGRVLQFSTGRRSLESCVNMVFGEFDYDNISKIRGSGVYYWSYLMIVSIILLNMMLAIVMGAYDDMSKEVYHGTINKLLVNRMTHYGRDLFYRMMRRCKDMCKGIFKPKQKDEA